MKCFISYSWESESHKKWVREFATKLRHKGVDVALDQWDAHPGIDLTKFMEENIRESNYVLLICTPTFAKKANEGFGGVGYEKSIVTGEIFQGVGNDGKFIPILRVGDPKHSLPSFLLSSYFINFKNETSFNDSLQVLLRHIFNEPLFTKPALGTKPVFNSVSSEIVATESNNSVNSFEVAYKFAYSPQGMDKTRSGAEEFANNWMSQHPGKDISKFIEIYKFAYSPQGMDKTRSGAEEFAKHWMSQDPGKDVSKFIQTYKFAYSPQGMDKTRSGAEEFAKHWMSQDPGKDVSKFIQTYKFAYSPQGMDKTRSGAEEFAFNNV